VNQGEGRKLTRCKADPEEATFDEARFLRSGQQAGSGILMIHHRELISTNEGEERKLHLQSLISSRYYNARKVSRPLVFGIVSNLRVSIKNHRQ